MNQTYDKFRKIMCAAGSLSFILLTILGTSILKNADNYTRHNIKMSTNTELIITTIVLGFIILFDAVSVFSESFHSSMEETELKYKFIPIAEALVLTNSILGLAAGAFVLSFLYFFRGWRLSGDKASLLFFLVLSALITSAYLIMILLNKFEIARTITCGSKSQNNFPNQNNQNKNAGFTLDDTSFFMDSSYNSQNKKSYSSYDFYRKHANSNPNDYEIYTSAANTSQNSGEFQTQGQDKY